MSEIKFYNSLTRTKEAFMPIDENHIKMYVCGVTPYDYPHIGNGRSAMVFDTLFRFLKSQFPKVTYLRNFTDVDDKIIARANDRGITCEELTKETIDIYHRDMSGINVLHSADDASIQEPLVTTHMDEIVSMIVTLLDRGFAYVGETGDVLYDTTKFPEYGKLSNKKLDELIAGARVEVSTDKKNPTDFVLWKSAKPGEPKWNFDAKYPAVNAGRPGWHIECSAMAEKEFGNSFDIHGGGEDLQFPHHECEIAQSKGACGGDHARYWMHNAFITVDGERMGKSVGNFVTIEDALKKYSGEAIRLWALSTHYRKRVDYSDEALAGAEKAVASLMRAVENADGTDVNEDAMAEFNKSMADDLNTAGALSVMHEQAKKARAGDNISANTLLKMGDALGLLQTTPEEYFKGEAQEGDAEIDALVAARNTAKAEKNWAEADRIRDELTSKGIILEDGKNGTTWRRA